jgi:predicted membrane GTPase involved in stress response
MSRFDMTNQLDLIDYVLLYYHMFILCLFCIVLQGVQAQTVANFSLALESDLAIVPVMNKIDLKTAQPDVVAHQMNSVFGIDTGEILKVISVCIVFCCFFVDKK